jgi:hypothetical protein
MMRRYVLEEMQRLRTHDPMAIWLTDSDGLSQTRTGMAAIPTQFAIVNFGDPKRGYGAFIQYPDNPDHRSMLQAIESADVIRSRTGDS